MMYINSWLLDNIAAESLTVTYVPNKTYLQ